ncbi:asparagine synthase B [uncultured Faecalibaculum sp.]|uniref:asparagine synthase B n=1 Tax=uncultured Faecalibaculum sp. TaxID=1729681 RepID=UPI0026275D90|nr:asparagine synthase B [uncultured Faecalibaculum sp.]
MCTVIGTRSSFISEQDLTKALEATTSRGPDDMRIMKHNAGILGFQRLAIMGLTPEGMQPFALNGALAVCNGEIYGFRSLKNQLQEKGYVFQSDSDCEILLPLFEEYGTDMFGMLDAEYACILLTAGGDILAARDPFGIRPLYYGYAADGQPVFASEPKNLTGLTDRIMPFPPGHYYADGAFHCYRDLTAVSDYLPDDVDAAAAGIRDRLVEGVRKRLDADAPLGYLLSGGLDSSLVCAIGQKLSDKPIRTFAIGMNTDAIDLKYARQAADWIGSDHREIIMTKQDVLEALDPVIRTLATYDITTIRASIGMYLICRAIRETTNVRVLLTGEISDELFGYKYTDFAPDAEAFQQEACKRVRELHMYDVLRADRCISVHSMEARVPFGDLDFADYVMHLDPAIKMNVYGKGKYLLRRAFMGTEYLPQDLLMREKAAFSDAVGHSMADDLRQLAEETYTDEEFEQRRQKYTHARPFTKESLLYREIFEKYYPGQSQMVTDFWMPNRDWEGCQVNDPSARYLSNYGASGQ